MSKIIKTAVLASTVVFGAVASMSTQAHPRWILPSHFTVSKQGGDWLTFDVTASNGTFVFDKPASAEATYVLLPDGVKKRPDAVFKGKRRSVLDYYFEQEGTHKVAFVSGPDYYTSYKAGESDELMWVKASKAERSSVLPKQAKDVETKLFSNRVETYITLGKPTEKAFTIEGKFLELKPVTHPSDIVEGEPVTFQFFYEGEPQQGVKAEITRDGTLYRNQPNEINVISDAKGEVTFTPQQAGRYLMKASYQGKLKDATLADFGSASLNLTFETQLN
ncbi:DUF4198 domain-containing protein [Vibrio sp. HN007]|uniref:DUF4198 domain-containing protein n=1 Tax=Vibrio iocasae TaxID=3098914 RepID=UPI0035D4DDC6